MVSIRQLNKTAKQLDKPIQVTYTGVVPIVYKAQRTLLHSLIDSIGWAFVMIAARHDDLAAHQAIAAAERPGWTGLDDPNVLPVVLIFGAMGHLGVLVDIGTMMTASVAMGVAVDDTIHFLTWFRRGIREGMKRDQAIREGVRTCGRGHDADHPDRRARPVGLRTQHIHADTAIRHHDADAAGRRTVRRPDPAARSAGRTVGQISLSRRKPTRRLSRLRIFP